MSLLLFVALGGYLIASRINQSVVIGLILVGIVVGPSMLGWITYTDFVAGLAKPRCCTRAGIPQDCPKRSFNGFCDLGDLYYLGCSRV